MAIPPTRPVRTSAPAATVSSRRTALREVLRKWEPAAGPNGFEGLIAHALAELTGFTFRLARSGMQFGRDAATPSAPFSIAMEAKRYSKSVPLQELVGKATLAAFALAEGVDVWVLAATIEVGEGTERQLAEILETGGITLLTLDWTDTGIPPLATLLASVLEEVISWARTRLSAPKLASLRAGLEDIAADSTFAGHRNTLIERLSPALVGLDALRAHNLRWCETHFGSQRRAQRAFSQFLNPLETPALSAARPAVQTALEAAFATARADPEGDTLVAVLGGEGAGKSWAVATWWHSADPRPILLLSVGRLADLLLANDHPLDMLARLAAHQDGRSDAEAIARWRRRLARWSKAGAASQRFMVLLDGLNETSGKPWSTIVQLLLPAVRALGGVLVVTSRERYWEREIEPRLPFIAFAKVLVGDYDDAEFADIMSKNGVDVSGLPRRLNRFMRNPRICALAITILPQLSEITDLNVDRLLMEYWRSRLRERSDLIAHNEDDFRDLLVRHAREYRERPGTDFNRDEWRNRSGAAQRGDNRDLANDLTDIEEGRFFDVESRSYRFREQTLHFALGLLVADEIADAVRAAPETVDEALAGILDPVRGFDTVGDIISAAIATATLDSRYPARGVAALVTALMALQNLTDQTFEGLVPYVAARPEPFLDAFERRDLERDDGRFLQLLIVASQRDSVASAMDARAERWLGSWSRVSTDWGDASEQVARQAQREARIDDRLADMTEGERIRFNELCAELPTAAGLAGTAALYLYGLPLARFARGIVAFSLAHTIAGSHRSPYDDIAWVLRLNRVDFDALAAAVRAELAEFMSATASETARDAAACALRLLGSLDAQIQAETLRPPAERTAFGDGRVDPLDPEAEAPDGIAELSERIYQIDPAVIWNHMSVTSEDHDLERNFNLLARFDIGGLAHFLDRVAATVATRTDMPLRQLGWHLPWLSPVLGDDALNATLVRISEVLADPSLMPAGDHDFIVGMMVEGVFPKLHAGGQLDLLQSLPPSAPYYLRYSVLAKPMAADQAAPRLSAALGGNPQILERTLLFLAASTSDMSEDLRRGVGAAMQHPNHEVVAAAANFARSREDDDLDDALLTLPTPADDDDSWRAGVVRAAIAGAIARRGRGDLVARVPLEHIDWVAARLPAARTRLADVIDATLTRFIQPIVAEEPTDATIVLEVGDDPTDMRINLVDRGEQRDDPVAAFNAAANDATGEVFARRRQVLHQQLERFMLGLTDEGALMVARRPFTIGLTEVAREFPERYIGWLERIVDTTDERALRRLQNLGIALAQNYVGERLELAAQTFAHLWKIEPHVTMLVGAAKHSFRDLALFTAPASAEFDQLRVSAFEGAREDASIERLVVAAEAAGAGVWLDKFVESHAASTHPSDQALALTAASFRRPNCQSTELFDRDWRRGFLGHAADAARARYKTALQSEHWLGLAAESVEPRERWQLLQLAVAAADRRQLINPDPRVRNAMREIGGDVSQRLDKAVEKASEEAKKTFMGMRKPTGLLDRIVRA